jgi:L-iditol 2-dehydrogenase
MRSIALVAPRLLEEHSLPDPADPGPGQVLVKLRAVGICGSDMHWFLDGRIGRTQAAFPQVLGHEPVGEIIAVGPGVHHRKPGDRVSIEPSITCGHCAYCLKGQHNNCPSCVFLGGPQAPGLFREYAVVPEHNADLIPASLSWNQATLIEPLAVIVHVMELVPIRFGDTVAVMGAGPIGMLCAAMAKQAGAARVYICDPLPHRRQLALAMCADVALTAAEMAQAISDETHGLGVDLVLDAAAATETVRTGITITKPSGTYMIIGIPSEHGLPIDIHEAMNKEIRILTLKRSNHKGAAAAQLLASGRVKDTLITHTLPFGETARGFDLLANYADNVGKVVIAI